MEEREVVLRQFHRDGEYYEANQEVLRERFPEQWVAIFEEQVVGADPDLEALFDHLEATRVPVGRVYTHWVTRKPVVLFLWL